MVDVIKLKALGYDVEHITPSENSGEDKIVHHMLKGYKKFNEDYIHLLSDHAHQVFGVEDKEEFRQNLLQKAQNNEKDDALHCALSIMSIHHRKKHHEENGHGVSYPEAHRIVVNFLQSSSRDQVQELHDRFPHVTRDVLSYVAPDYEAEELSA